MKPSFDQVFREHRDRVWRTLRRLRVPDEDVDDVAQEVFIVVLRQLEGFRGEAKLSTWIYSICIKAAADYRKKAFRRHEDRGAPVPDIASTATQEDLLSERRARLVLDTILDKLDDDKRAVFVLFEIEQLSMQDVADITGSQLSTAYYRLNAARAQITEHIATLREEEGRQA